MLCCRTEPRGQRWKRNELYRRIFGWSDCQGNILSHFETGKRTDWNCEHKTGRSTIIPSAFCFLERMPTILKLHPEIIRILRNQYYDLILTWFYSPMKEKYFLLLMALLPVLAFSQNTLHRISDSEKSRCWLPEADFTVQNWRNHYPTCRKGRTRLRWMGRDRRIDCCMDFYPVILKEIVRYAQDETNVFIICSDSASKNYLTVSGVPQTRIQYIVALNPIWDCRDYGPWNIYSDDVDSLSFDRLDIQSSTSERRYCSFRDWKTHRSSMYQTTVAQMILFIPEEILWRTDLGTGFSSNLIVDENPGHSIAEIDTIMSQFMGVTVTLKWIRFLYDGIHHIDMHMKLLDEETILWENILPGCWRTGYRSQSANCTQHLQFSFRDALQSRSYTHASRCERTISKCRRWLQNLCECCICKQDCYSSTYAQQYDTTALRIWEKQCRVARVVGIDCNSIIPSLGAIHCITKK